MNESTKPSGNTNWVLVTPELATEWLKRNKNDRNIDYHTVSQYAEDMKNGTYRANGETICFDWNGCLRNGQHRLHAVIRSGKSIWMNVLTGADPAECDIYDFGKKRTAKQVTEGASKDALSVAAKIIIGNDLNSARVPIGTQRNYYLQHSEELEKVCELPRKGTSDSICRRLGCSVAAYLAFRNGISEAIIEDFFTATNTGMANSDDYDCSSCVWLARQINNMKKGGRQPRTWELACITIQAIIEYQNKKPRSRYYKLDDETWKKYLHNVRIQDSVIEE